MVRVVGQSSQPEGHEPDRASGPFDTLDHERWAEALAVVGRHGEGAAVHVAERIGQLALAGDQAGIDRWVSIAHRIDQLMGAGRQ